MISRPKLVSILSEETGYFVDVVCPICLEWVGGDDCSGFCDCGYQIPLSLIVPYDFNWDYSEQLISQFKNYVGLRIAGRFIGNHPEKLNLLSHVKYLKLSRYKGFEFEFLHSFSSLDSLTLDYMQFETLDGINNIKPLLSLSLVECRKLNSLSGIEGMKNLKILEVAICNKISDLTPLSDLLNLEYLLLDSKSIESMNGLKNENLKKLVFSNDARVKDKDLSPLYKLKKLEYLKLKKSLFKASAIKEFQKKKPMCNVVLY